MKPKVVTFKKTVYIHSKLTVRIGDIGILHEIDEDMVWLKYIVEIKNNDSYPYKFDTTHKCFKNQN